LVFDPLPPLMTFDDEDRDDEAFDDDELSV
jgi:hypothetical protein